MNFRDHITGNGPIESRKHVREVIALLPSPRQSSTHKPPGSVAPTGPAENKDPGAESENQDMSYKTFIRDLLGGGVSELLDTRLAYHVPRPGVEPLDPDWVDAHGAAEYLTEAAAKLGFSWYVTSVGDLLDWHSPLFHRSLQQVDSPGRGWGMFSKRNLDQVARDELQRRQNKAAQEERQRAATAAAREAERAAAAAKLLASVAQ